MVLTGGQIISDSDIEGPTMVGSDARECCLNLL